MARKYLREKCAFGEEEDKKRSAMGIFRKWKIRTIAADVIFF